MPRQYSTLVEVLESSAEAYSERRVFGECIAGRWQWTTYGEFYDIVRQARAALRCKGLGMGSRVALISNNRVEWAAMAYATYGIGATFIPMYEVQSAEEWEYILQDCEAELVLGTTEAIFEQLEQIQPNLPNLKSVFGLDLKKEHAASWDSFLNLGDGGDDSVADVKSEALAGLIYTSGTTGKPKGVMLSHKNICANLFQMHHRFEMFGEFSLSFLPWAHAFGQVCELHDFIAVGATIAINDEVSRLVDNLAQLRPTILVAVPRIFNRIYDGVQAQMRGKPAAIRALFEAGLKASSRSRSGLPLSLVDRVALNLADKLIFSKIRLKFGGRLKLVISGSAALNPEIAEFIDALGIMVYEGYGLSETSPVCATNYPGHRKIGSIGPALPGVRIEIDESLSDVPGEGELIIHGDHVMMGYLNQPETTREVMKEDGGFRTGDLGRVDSDGYYYITGRIKEQYKLETGKYVAPALLEERLKMSRFISHVMLYGANKPYNVALIVPDLTNIREWASQENVTGEPLSQHPRVLALLMDELNRLGADFKSYEKPKRILIREEDFTAENGYLTPSLKLKRRVVFDNYCEALNELYKE